MRSNLLFRKIVKIVLILIGIAYLSIVVSSLMSKTPNYVGVKNGRLSPAFAAKPNNITTYEAGAYPQEEPLHYSGDQAAAKQRLITLVNGLSRSELVTNEGDYLHFTVQSRLFRFVDDVEFLFDDENKQIHFRASSRMGYSDMNVNQKRMAGIRERFEK